MTAPRTLYHRQNLHPSSASSAVSLLPCSFSMATGWCVTLSASSSGCSCGYAAASAAVPALLRPVADRHQHSSRMDWYHRPWPAFATQDTRYLPYRDPDRRSGENEGARSLGFGNGQTLRYISSCRKLSANALPQVGNNLIALLKDTALVSVIGVTELVHASQQAISETIARLNSISRRSDLLRTQSHPGSRITGWKRKSRLTG